MVGLVVMAQVFVTFEVTPIFCAAVVPAKAAPLITIEIDTAPIPNRTLCFEILLNK
jgi:hypothetical protein